MGPCPMRRRPDPPERCLPRLVDESVTVPRDVGSNYGRSKRSRFITLAHAATKSRTNFARASSLA